LTHPLKVAEEAGMIDVLSNGRLELGVGRGSLAHHFRGFGVSQDDGRERMLEGIEMIRAAWTSERLNFAGRFFNAKDVEVVPKPVQAMPVIRIATNSKDSFVEHGRLGFPIFVGTHVNRFDGLRELLPIYRAARREAGYPDLGGDEVTMLVPVFVGDSHEQVRRDIEHSVRNNYDAAGNLPAESEWLKQVLERYRRTTYEQAAEDSCIYGPPEYCIERIDAIRRELGIGRMICWFNSGGQVPHKTVMRSMEMFAAKVMPSFKNHADRPVLGGLKAAVAS
jgi:alkanesulfonate monooxygenase SsuD/methylene tetrahydromethanopterin reductase-like flavin-dependent oxidoreductase (luciferase family)